MKNSKNKKLIKKTTKLYHFKAAGARHDNSTVGDPTNTTITSLTTTGVHAQK